MTRRATLWATFFASAPWNHYPDLPPAFVQEGLVGLWNIQRLVRQPKPHFSWLHRLLNDPPSENNYIPSYQLMLPTLPTKEEARDYWQLYSGLIDYEEYRERPSTLWSGTWIYLDNKGNFQTLLPETLK